MINKLSEIKKDSRNGQTKRPQYMNYVRVLLQKKDLLMNKITIFEVKI